MPLSTRVSPHGCKPDESEACQAQCRRLRYLLRFDAQIEAGWNAKIDAVVDREQQVDCLVRRNGTVAEHNRIGHEVAECSKSGNVMRVRDENRRLAFDLTESI